MISNDFLIELSSWGMNVEKLRAQVAAENIANSTTTGQMKSVDFESLIKSVSTSMEVSDIQHARHSISEPLGNYVQVDDSRAPGHSLDSEVADMSAANGRFKTMAEALSRKFGLMNIAARGE
ncbi:hypothetical protein TDB9533_02888 [Thalassocella blandensis]|nr:hypothetical protein TDB9533_02888 [Thalassocella blandensis]